MEVWARNVAPHRYSFRLPRASGPFFPVFVARLVDGRVLVVVHGGRHLMGTADEREKTAIGQPWARAAGGGGAFATVEQVRHGIDVAGQLWAFIHGKADGSEAARRLA